MAKYNFNGDISGISNQQLEFINNVLQEHRLQNSKVTLEPVGKAGDNYVACVKRIIIEGETESLSIIAKIAPSNEVQRKLMNSDVLFRNEHVMYLDILPKLVQLQKHAGIPEKDQLKYAKCYGSSDERPNEVILLEDLQPLEFKMLDRFKPLSNNCVKSILKNFALLHSSSFALKYNEPETFDTFKVKILDMMALQVGSEEMKIFSESLETEMISILEDAEYISVVRHKIVNLMDLVAKFSKSDLDSKYSVILHGDAWTNNIMFKMEGDEVIESIMIDYQVSRISSPVVDIMYTIFNCTDYESRKQNYYVWIDYYYLELEKCLSDLNLKVNFVYPRDQLDADLKRYAKLSFGISLILCSTLIRKSDDAAKMMEAMKNENIAEQVEEFAVSKLDDDSINLFRNRIIGLIRSFTEFGLV